MNDPFKKALLALTATGRHPALKLAMDRYCLDHTFKNWVALLDHCSPDLKQLAVCDVELPPPDCINEHGWATWSPALIAKTVGVPEQRFHDDFKAGGWDEEIIVARIN